MKQSSIKTTALRSIGFGAALLSLGPLAAPAALAESLSVSPTRMEVPASNQTTLTLKADGKEASVLQLRVMEWKEGQDPSKMKATRDVVISPRPV